MLPLKLPFPAYTAVIECVPAVREDVVNVARPLVSSEVDPSVVVPSMNVTVPVGTPDPLTVAVKVTPAPKVDGLLLDATVVVVGLLMMSVTPGAVWVRLLLVPVIVNGKLPVGVVGLDVIAMVEDPDVVTDVGVKLAVTPDGNPVTLNVTVPVNPPDGVTVAV